MITHKNAANSLIFAGLLLGLTQTTHAELTCTPHLAKWSGVGFLFISAAALFKRKPINDFVQRGELKSLTKINTVLTSDYWKNIFYLWYDGFVGQRSTESYLKGDNGKIVMEEEVDAHGLLGHLNDYVEPFAKGITSLGFALFAYRTLTAHPSENLLGQRIEEKSNPKTALHVH